MYDDEPRALCNIPLSGTVGILSSLVLLSQVLALFLVCSNNFFIYFFELIIAFGMVFFLSQGVRHRKPGHLTVYLAYLAIYVFMMFFIIFGILVGISFYPSYKRECERRSAATTSITPTATTASDLSSTSSAETVTVHPNRIYVAVIPSRSDTNCEPIHGAFWAEIWSSIALCFLSIIIACIQIRYTLLLYKFMRLHQREQRATMNVSYQHFVPGAPPRYTPESPYTVQSSPAQVEAGPLPPKQSMDSVATLEAESLANDSHVAATAATATGPPPPPPPPSTGEQPISDKNTLPPSFLRVENPPEYTEIPGPSESSLLPQTATTPTSPDHSRMEDVPLNDPRSPSRVDLLS